MIGVVWEKWLGNVFYPTHSCALRMGFGYPQIPTSGNIGQKWGTQGAIVISRIPQNAI